jgi:hypothetical protein
MSATLTTLRDRVEVMLADTSNAIWSADALAEALRQALHEYSKAARPLQAIGTVTLSADGREFSISTLTGLLAVLSVWLPYTAADPEDPPEYRGFTHWYDAQKLYVVGGDEPQSGDVARVFYTKLQTLSGLDSATATTFPDDDETLLATGACGFAATSRAVDLVERVTLDRLSSQQIRAWGLSKLQEFRAGLKVIAQRAAVAGLAHFEAGELDRWEGDWS